MCFQLPPGYLSISFITPEKKDSVGLNKRYFTATILKVSDKTTLKRCLVFYHFVAIMYFRTHLTKAQQFGIPLDNMIIEEFRQCFTWHCRHWRIFDVIFLVCSKKCSGRCCKKWIKFAKKGLVIILHKIKS